MLIKPSTLDNIFNALADRNRRSMFDALCDGPAPVTELANLMPVTPSAVLQHLDVLEAAGLVRSEKTGRVRTCQVQFEALKTIQYWLDGSKRNLRRAKA